MTSTVPPPSPDYTPLAGCYDEMLDAGGAPRAHWAQPCIRVDKFTGRNQKDYVPQCFVFLDGNSTNPVWGPDGKYLVFTSFPAADIGLMRALADADGRRPTPIELSARAEAWRPWRAYAALHLWASQAPALDTKESADDRDAA